MKPIIMPQVGQDIPSGIICEWLKKEGDPVEKGEAIATVESEKAVFEIEAEESGTLLKILFPEGSEVEILKTIGYTGQDGESVEESSSDDSVDTLAISTEEPPPHAESPESSPKLDKPVASPAVRRMAREKQVNLACIEGSGPGGRITKDDVLAAASVAGKSATISQKQSAPGLSAKPQIMGKDTVIPFGRMRKRIAEKLTHSKQTIPHYCVQVDVDMTDADNWRRCLNAEQDLHITITDLLVKATATALHQFPRLNSHVDGEQIVLKGNINVGVAVAVEEGLLVPVIPDADQKGLQEISSISKKNAEAARHGVMPPEPLGTFTVSSLGMHGIKQFTPIINPPECAILAVGAVEPRVVPVSGGIGVRKMMTITLACDHRGVDGADAAGLLQQIKNTLERAQEIPKEWV